MYDNQAHNNLCCAHPDSLKLPGYPALEFVDIIKIKARNDTENIQKKSL